MAIGTITQVMVVGIKSIVFRRVCPPEERATNESDGQIN